MSPASQRRPGSRLDDLLADLGAPDLSSLPLEPTPKRPPRPAPESRLPIRVERTAVDVPPEAPVMDHGLAEEKPDPTPATQTVPPVTDVSSEGQVEPDDLDIYLAFGSASEASRDDEIGSASEASRGDEIQANKAATGGAFSGSASEGLQPAARKSTSPHDSLYDQLIGELDDQKSEQARRATQMERLTGRPKAGGADAIADMSHEQPAGSADAPEPDRAPAPAAAQDAAGAKQRPEEPWSPPDLAGSGAASEGSAPRAKSEDDMPWPIPGDQVEDRSAGHAPAPVDQQSSGIVPGAAAASVASAEFVQTRTETQPNVGRGAGLRRLMRTGTHAPLIEVGTDDGLTRTQQPAGDLSSSAPLPEARTKSFVADGQVSVTVRSGRGLATRRLTTSHGQRLAGAISPLAELWHVKLGWRGRENERAVVLRALGVRAAMLLLCFGLLVKLTMLPAGGLLPMQAAELPDSLLAQAWSRGPVAFVEPDHEITLADGSLISSIDERLIGRSWSAVLAGLRPALEGGASIEGLKPWLTRDMWSSLDGSIRHLHEAGDQRLIDEQLWNGTAPLELAGYQRVSGVDTVAAIVEGPLAMKTVGADGMTTQELAVIEVSFIRGSDGVWRLSSVVFNT